MRGEVALIASGLDPDDVEAVLDDLAVQIEEMANSSDAGSPDAVAREVLAHLDPPEAFEAAEGATEDLRPPDHAARSGPRPRGLSLEAALGAISAGACLGGLLLGPAVGAGAGASHLGYVGEEVGWLVFCAMQATALLAGLFALEHPLGRLGVAGAVGLPALAMALAALFG